MYGVQVLHVEDVHPALANNSPLTTVPRDAAAYVIFTSGSTGRETLLTVLNCCITETSGQMIHQP
jgi:acyl-coenzyme A synthetase/AMP-(fatty) acid ligase